MSVRQTNVVWLAFTMAVSVLREIRDIEEKESLKEDEGVVKMSDVSLGEADGISERCLFLPEDSKLSMSTAQIVTSALSAIRTIRTRPRNVWPTVLPYIPTFLGLFAFLRWNGGIVLGQSVFGLAQPKLK